jgi:adenylate cyclase
LLEQAIAIDPHYGPALCLAAVCRLRLVVNGWSEEPEASGLKATNLARQALDVGANDPDILVNSAFVLAQFGEDHGAMIGLVDRALALNPSFAFGWQMSGNLRIFAGQLDLAIDHVQAALRLSPRQRTGSPLTALGVAYFYKRQFERSGVDADSGHSRQSGPYHLIPRSCGLLRPYGTARRRARNCRQAAGHHS